MILHCEHCNTRYLVDHSSIGPDGRTVRCAKCGHDWFQAAPANYRKPSPEPMPEFVSAEEDMDFSGIGGLPAVTGPRYAPAGVKWSVPLLLLCCLLAGALALRPSLTSMVPAMKPLYNAVGLTDSSGLALADISFKKLASSKNSRYAIAGNIVNETDEVKKFPLLRVSLVDDHGEVLQFWDNNSEGKEIAPKESIAFQTDRLETRFKRGTHFIVELGNSFELSQRH